MSVRYRHARRRAVERRPDGGADPAPAPGNASRSVRRGVAPLVLLAQLAVAGCTVNGTPDDAAEGGRAADAAPDTDPGSTSADATPEDGRSAPGAPAAPSATLDAPASGDGASGEDVGGPDASDAPRASAKTLARGEAEHPLGTLLVTLEALRERTTVDEPLEIRVTARNATAEGAELLTWNTPFEASLSADLFEVTRGGERLPYRGRRIKRALPPTNDDIVPLAPNESLETVVDLARYYALDEPGRYRVRFVPRPLDVGAPEGAFATLLAADEDSLVVERR